MGETRRKFDKDFRDGAVRLMVYRHGLLVGGER